MTKRTQSRKRIDPSRVGTVRTYDNGAVVVRHQGLIVEFGDRREAKHVSTESPDELCGIMVDKSSHLTIEFPNTCRDSKEVENKLFWLKKVQRLSSYREIQGTASTRRFTLVPSCDKANLFVVGELPKCCRVTHSFDPISTSTPYHLRPTKYDKNDKTPYKPTDTTNAHDPDRTSDYDA